jgi:hypothetical protein
MPSKMCNSSQFTPVTPAIQEAAIRRITVQSQPRQIVHKTLCQKYPTQKRAGRVAAQGEFNPCTAKKKKKR